MAQINMIGEGSKGIKERYTEQHSDNNGGEFVERKRMSRDMEGKRMSRDIEIW